MRDFLADLPENPFLVTGLVAGLLASIACGLIGPYVVVRRIVFLAGAIAHMAVGGVGTAIWARSVAPEALDWLRPIHGAMVAALVAAVVIGIIHRHASERIDTLIGALWAVGMSVGVMLMKFTPGYQVELMSYLFGNIVFVDWSDVRLIGMLDLAIVGAVLLCHKRFVGICVDEEQCTLQGVDVFRVHLLLLALAALTVICLVQVVGLILVLALLTLPAATAGHHLGRMGPIMLASIVLCMLLTTLPRAAVYGSRISPESAIVLAACAVYLLSLLLRTARRRRRAAAPQALAGAAP